MWTDLWKNRTQSAGGLLGGLWSWLLVPMWSFFFEAQSLFGKDPVTLEYPYIE